MDVKIENLIEKIRKEGVEEAQHTSEEILEKARQEAAAIIHGARQEAEEIIENARKEGERFRKNSEEALRQAARDVQLLLKEKIIDLFDRSLKKEISAALSPEFLKTLILKITDQWLHNGKSEITLNKTDKARLQALLFSNAREALKKSVTIKVSDAVSKGFRIGLNGENVYYDFSDESIAEALKTFLNPELKEILDQENG